MNRLCEIAGYENFHSIQHLYNMTQKKNTIKIRDFVPDFPLL